MRTRVRRDLWERAGYPSWQVVILALALAAIVLLLFPACSAFNGKPSLLPVAGVRAEQRHQIGPKVGANLMWPSGAFVTGRYQPLLGDGSDSGREPTDEWLNYEVEVGIPVP